MPFKKIGDNKYVSPSGRHWTKKQVIAYYASGGFEHGEQVPEDMGVELRAHIKPPIELTPSGRIFTRSQINKAKATHGFTRFDDEAMAYSNYHLCDCGYEMAFDGQMRCAECGRPVDVRKLSSKRRTAPVGPAPLRSAGHIQVPANQSAPAPPAVAAGEIKLYSPDQPRDDHGRWASMEVSGGTLDPVTLLPDRGEFDRKVNPSEVVARPEPGAATTAHGRAAQLHAAAAMAIAHAARRAADDAQRLRSYRSGRTDATQIRNYAEDSVGDAMSKARDASRAALEATSRAHASASDQLAAALPLHYAASARMAFKKWDADAGSTMDAESAIHFHNLAASTHGQAAMHKTALDYGHSAAKRDYAAGADLSQLLAQHGADWLSHVK